jgi:hypothetical protein
MRQEGDDTDRYTHETDLRERRVQLSGRLRKLVCQFHTDVCCFSFLEIHNNRNVHLSSCNTRYRAAIVPR